MYENWGFEQLAQIPQEYKLKTKDDVHCTKDNKKEWMTTLLSFLSVYLCETV